MVAGHGRAMRGDRMDGTVHSLVLSHQRAPFFHPEGLDNKKKEENIRARACGELEDGETRWDLRCGT